METRNGNFVQVHSLGEVTDPVAPLPSGVRAFAADVEVCAGRDPDVLPTVAPQQFILQTSENLGAPAAAAVREPALHRAELRPEGCIRGWVSFRLPAAAVPAGVVMRTSTVVRWALD